MLAFDDSFAGRLTTWRDELAVWERGFTFSAWETGRPFCLLKKPPPVPTVKRCGRTTDKELLARRQAVYDVADAERTEAHSRWVAMNSNRKKERDKVWQAEYDSKRDWADEREDREKVRMEEEEATRPVHPTE